MIIGIGVDIVEISRIERVCQKPKSQEKIFTPQELAYAQDCGHFMPSLAGIFCAKEAISKALGTGFRGFSLLDIEIKHTEIGTPLAELRGGALEKAKSLGIAAIHLTITHHKTDAVAMAVAEG